MHFYAHSTIAEDRHDWELLEEHLRQVAAKAGALAAVFDAEQWGRVAGLWHDMGKYRPEFQARLRGERIQAEHAGVGAALALEKGSAGVPVAFAIAGHHSGLANLKGQGDSERRPLLLRIEDNKGALVAVRAVAPKEILDADLPALPEWLQRLTDRDAERRSAEMFTRFIFSALVDADRLCTEAFYEPNKRAPGGIETIGALSRRLDCAIDALGSSVDSTQPVNRSRAEVLSACRTRADEPPGFFSLTVPTGGGKTLSAMSFALRHAARHGLRRVVVVIPYTSIIEQNAKIYASVLGEENVIEHHSNLDEEKAREENPEREARRQLATENWDAPVIVTTTVQFFESLFSAHPSRCRKLHNLAKSVILLDEVQTLPPSLLSPILDGLQELVQHYGCSVILSTATPPALSQPHLTFGLAEVREIVSDPAGLAGELRRVEVKWPRAGEVVSYSDLSGQITAHARVLAIVHLRKDARRLAELLPPSGCYHLSALMCPAHRLKVLAAVKKALNAPGEVCRLVSTQLVEAGVDLDFPVVYRALAGLDSLAQAAGRCNREGRLMDATGQRAEGQFNVFRAETKPPPGVLRMAIEGTEGLLAAHGDGLDLLAPASFTEFFRGLYFKSDVDSAGIQMMRRDLNFADVARSFHMIDDYTIPVIVPYEDARERLNRYRRWPNRASRRALQPFIVHVAPSHLRSLEESGAIERIDEGVMTLTEPFSPLYDRVFGLSIGADIDTSSAWVV